MVKAYRNYCDKCASAKKICSKCGEEKEYEQQQYVDKNEKNIDSILYENEIKGLGLREKKKLMRMLQKGEVEWDQEKWKFVYCDNSQDDIELDGESEEAEVEEQERKLEED